jgi:hypothetical protein
MDNAIWTAPTNCVAGRPGFRGIRDATANSITIEMDIDNDEDIGNDCVGEDAGNEIISYAYLSGTTDLRITRETQGQNKNDCSCGAGGAQPFLGATEGGPAARTVRVINETLNLPLFRYFDGAGAELFPTAGDQSSVPNIRRINITIAVETADIDPTSGQRRRLIYGTSVIPKNHGITVNTATP